MPSELTLLLGEPEPLGYGDLQHSFGKLIHAETWEMREILQVLAKAGAWIEGALPLGDEPFIKPWMIDLVDEHYALDCGRARRLIGWKPHHSPRNTLPAMVRALRAGPAAWYRENQLDPPAGLAKRGESAPGTTGRWADREPTGGQISGAA